MAAAPARTDHLALEQLQLLRQRLRDALDAKKDRMRELADLAKREQVALRAWVQQRRQDALRALRQDVQRARAAAKTRRSELLAEARRSGATQVEVARRAVEIEVEHAAQQRRISLAHQAEREHITRSHHRAVAKDETPSSAMLARLRPLLEKAGPIRPAPGESQTEAIWRYARAHPEQMHALVEPRAEGHIARTQVQIAALESNLRSGAARRPSSPASAGRAPRAVPLAIRPAKRQRSSTTPAIPQGKRRRQAQRRLKPSEPARTSADSPKIEAAPHPSAPQAVVSAGPKASMATPTPPASPSTSLNPHEQKIAARIERQRAKAAGLRLAAGDAQARARAIGAAIPPGQPVLVGHHSQRRHERDLARMDRAMRKSIELGAAATRLERRAARAEAHPVISSDDPEAVPKLRLKLEDLDRQREKMRAANAAIRAGGDAQARLVALGFSKERAAKLLQPDALGNVGFPAYALRNAASERTRLTARIQDLERRATSPQRPTEQVAGASLFEQDNRVRVSFPCVPPAAVRKQLKAAGFRWSPKEGAWQRMSSSAAWAEAKRILTDHAGAAGGPGSTTTKEPSPS